MAALSPKTAVPEETLALPEAAGDTAVDVLVAAPELVLVFPLKLSAPAAWETSEAVVLPARVSASEADKVGAEVAFPPAPVWFAGV